MRTIIDKILNNEIKEIFAVIVYVHKLESNYTDTERTEFVCSVDEAKKLQRQIYNAYEVDDMEEEIYIEVKVMKADKELLQEGLDEGYIEDDDDLKYSWLQSIEYFEDDERFLSLLKQYDYKSLEGALILEWCWDRYVGYAQKYIGFQIGTYEDESITIPQDYTYKSQFSVVLSKDEIESCDTDWDLYKAIDAELFRILDKCNSYPDTDEIDDMIDEIYGHSWLYSKLPERIEEDEE